MNDKKKQFVLIVDDDPELLNLFKTELHQEFEILTALNGEEGLLMTLQYKPDLIISDIKMPDLDGWDFCYLLRHIPSVRSIPFVFLSSRSDLPDRVQSMRLGADDFVAKPFSMEMLTTRIRILLERVRERQMAVEGALVQSKVNTLLIDLIEYLRLNRRSGVIEITGLGKSGAITLCEGSVTGAQFMESEGEPALRTLLQSGPAEIAFKERETQPAAPLISSWATFITSFLPD